MISLCRELRDITHPAGRLVQTMARIYQYRTTTTSGGNPSIRDSDGSIWIPPARVVKGALRVENIVRVLPDGSNEGHQPSSGIPALVQRGQRARGTRPSRACHLHLLNYPAHPEIRAIINATAVILSRSLGDAWATR